MSTVDDLGIAHADSPDGAVSLFNRRAPRISQADVFQAADALLVQGDRPTIDRVRMRLGRGSPNTINDHLDAWWAKLGARLRDIPGREFPHLPERVAQSLQLLWNEALAGAHATLQATLGERGEALMKREAALGTLEQQLAAREAAAAARTGALEEGLSLARDQLTAANQRAERLETTLQEREADYARVQGRLNEVEATVVTLRTKADAVEGAHRQERARLEERHAVAEGHWLGELDRARQATKAAASEHERQLKGLRARMEDLQSERENLRQQLGNTRAELKAANAVREHLEARIHRTQDSRAPARVSTQPRKRRTAKRARGV
jgi:DNA repair exonuclease SbcCD ATPase subunit